MDTSKQFIIKVKQKVKEGKYINSNKTSREILETSDEYFRVRTGNQIKNDKITNKIIYYQRLEFVYEAYHRNSNKSKVKDEYLKKYDLKSPESATCDFEVMYSIVENINCIVD
ncbi:MAG: hypothetical protein ACLFPL_05175 [Candidatus Nanoarchaeia archaeon]